MPTMIDVKSDFPLTDDQKRRLVNMVRGNGHFDYRDAYLDGEGMARNLQAIHFVKEPVPGVEGGESLIDSVDALRFETAPFLYLEDEAGGLTGWKVARERTPSRWHYGAIFTDEAGQGWFCGREESTGTRLDGEEPILRRISLETPAHVVAENGPILENMPAEGEFWLSSEDHAVVTSIPWWSGFGGEGDPANDWPERAASLVRENTALARMRERAAGLSAEASPAP
jgi:hypothetical protein